MEKRGVARMIVDFLLNIQGKLWGIMRGKKYSLTKPLEINQIYGKCFIKRRKL